MYKMMVEMAMLNKSLPKDVFAENATDAINKWSEIAKRKKK